MLFRSVELEDPAILNLIPMLFDRLKKGKAPAIFGDDYPTPAPPKKARFPPIEETPKGDRTLSGSGNRRETSQLSHPRLCDNRNALLIGPP